MCSVENWRLNHLIYWIDHIAGEKNVAADGLSPLAWVVSSLNLLLATGAVYVIKIIINQREQSTSLNLLESYSALETSKTKSKSKKRRENLLAISILAVNINTQLYPLKEFTAHSAQLIFSMWMNTFGQPFSPWWLTQRSFRLSSRKLWKSKWQ